MKFRGVLWSCRSRVDWLVARLLHLLSWDKFWGLVLRLVISVVFFVVVAVGRVRYELFYPLVRVLKVALGWVEPVRVEHVLCAGPLIGITMEHGVKECEEFFDL